MSENIRRLQKTLTLATSPACLQLRLHYIYKESVEDPYLPLPELLSDLNLIHIDK
jgi:hypothetical protein